MSFQVHDPNVGAVTLTRAILLYSAGQSKGSADSTVFATLHPVRCVGANGAPVIEPGQPVDRAGVLALAKSLSKTKRPARCGFLPDNVLSIGAGHIVWHQPAGTRQVFFDCGDKSPESVGKRSGTVPLPSLIFAARGRFLSVFAVKEKGRPTPDTPLFHAPFFNVWKEGKVCTGSTVLPRAFTPASIEAWDRAFFGSYFTHTNHEGVVRFKGGAHAFWNAMLEGQFKTFPNSVLKALPKSVTVGSVIDAIERREE